MIVSGMSEDKEYYTFISYIRKDKKKAKRLQHASEYYCLPNHLPQENPDLPELVPQFYWILMAICI